MNDHNHPLPSAPERLLRAAIADSAKAATIVGDLREEYAERPAGLRRTVGFSLVCLSIALRYGPGTLVDIARVDVRHARKALGRAKTYTLTSVATLALGIGTAATILTIAYGALARPLPYPDARELVRWGQTPLANPGGINSTAVANFIDLARHTSQFQGLAAEALRAANVGTESGAEPILASSVTANYFDVLGVRPTLGRGFTAEDDEPGATPVVLIGDRLWRRTFGAAPDVVGRAIRLDTEPHIVVGVLPAAVAFPGDPQAWTTFRWDANARSVRRRRNIEPIGRLRPGVSLERGRDELAAIFADLAGAHPADNSQSTVAAMAYSDWLLGRSGPNRALLPLIAAAAALLLFISFLNVTNLALGRAEASRHEHALRAALGASWLRQLTGRISEAVLVVGPAGLMSAAIASWAVPLVITRYGASIPRAATIAPDRTTAAIIAVASLVAVALLALSAGRSRSTGSLGLGRRATTTTLRLRRRLVTLQIGLASGLLYGAVLLGSMVATLARVDLGVPLDRAMTFLVNLPAGRYGDPLQIRNYIEDLGSRLSEMPGVLHVGATSRAPFAGGTNGGVAPVGDPAHAEPLAEWRTVTPGFFQALGLPLVAGRDFVASSGAPGRAAIVSESLGRTLFPDRSPVGGRVVLEGDRTPYEVRGVVGDLRDFGPTRPLRPTIYVRHGAEPGFSSARAMTFVVRTAEAPLRLVPEIRRHVRELDADVAVERLSTLGALATRSYGVSRTTAATVVVLFAAIALALGSIGVYGVMAFGVEARTREIGVRLAMGDTPPGIVRRILSDGLRLTAAGLALGAGIAWFLDGLLGTFVVRDAAPGQPVTVVISMALLTMATALACAVPARRASRLRPTEALRES